MRNTIKRVKAKQVSFGVLINIGLLVCLSMGCVQLGVMKDRANRRQTVSNLVAFQKHRVLCKRLERENMKGVELAFHRVRDFINE